jgi:hypothetical protein
VLAVAPAQVSTNHRRSADALRNETPHSSPALLQRAAPLALASKDRRWSALPRAVTRLMQMPVSPPQSATASPTCQ